MTNGLYEAFAILIILPLIVSIGAGSQINGKHSVSICKFLGNISYPLYITHYPLVYLQWAFLSNHPDASLGQLTISCAGTFLAAIFVAYAALKLYDVPVRKWLRKHWFAPATK